MSSDNFINNKSILSELDLTKHEITLLKSLEDFYDKTNYFSRLKNIIDGNSNISRRTIEYFVTNYSKKTRVLIECQNKTFNVHSSYKDQLKAHKKKYFDPFGRGVRIPFFYKDSYIITTIAQLNFYKWFFQRNIYDYCLTNLNEIQHSLSKSTKNFKNKVEKNKNNTVEPKPTSSKRNIIVNFD
jgi:hypothetical protein